MKKIVLSIAVAAVFVGASAFADVFDDNCPSCAEGETLVKIGVQSPDSSCGNGTVGVAIGTEGVNAFTNRGKPQPFAYTLQSGDDCVASSQYVPQGMKFYFYPVTLKSTSNSVPPIRATFWADRNDIPTAGNLGSLNFAVGESCQVQGKYYCPVCSCSKTLTKLPKDQLAKKTTPKKAPVKAQTRR